LANGIPDEAFTPIEGDEKTACSQLKKENKRERQDYASGQGYLFEPPIMRGNIAAEFAKLTADSEDTAQDVVSKEERYARLVRSVDYETARLWADTWSSVFVWKKDKSDLGRLCPTERKFRDIERNPHNVLPTVRTEIKRLREQYQFLHWHLAFPDVFGMRQDDGEAGNQQTGWSGGFDVVLGNPPWERVKLQEKEWFAERSPEIASAPNAATRKRLIQSLKTGDPSLYQSFLNDSRKAEGESVLMRNSGRYPLCGRGDVNTYTIFAELNRTLVTADGLVGCIVPSGIATDDTTKFFFQDVVDHKSLVSLFDFENKGIFPGVHSSYKFCLFTAGRGTLPSAPRAEFVFFAHSLDDLRDLDRRFTLSAEDIARLNPNTRTCPIFRSQRDAELTKAIYRRVPVLASEGPPYNNPWGVKIRRVIDMGNEKLARNAKTKEAIEALEIAGRKNLKLTLVDGSVFLPIYEGKMFTFFNHRDAGVVLNPENLVRGAQGVETTFAHLEDPFFLPEPLYWYPLSELLALEIFRDPPRWLLGYKNISSPTNERSMIAAAIPFGGSNFSIRIAFLSRTTQPLAGCFLANLNSFVFDYLVRQSLGGVNLSDYIIQQISTIPPDAYSQTCKWTGTQDTLRGWLLPRVLELTYTAWDLEPFAQDSGWSGPPFRWDENRRFLLRCELDAAFFHIYLPAEHGGDWLRAQHEKPQELARLKASFPSPRDAAAYIMDTFPIINRKDETKFNGDYRTKRVILEIFDAMAESIRTGNPYQTVLDPPPADPRTAHPARPRQE